MSSIRPREFASRSGKRVLLRSATTDDALELIKYCQTVLVACEFFVTQADELNVTEQQQREWIKTHVECDGSLMLLAEAEGSVVGLLSFGCGPRRRTSHVGTLAISVSEECRCEGIGNALMGSLIDWATQHPTIEKICLGVMVTNAPAIRLYRKLGFVEEGRRIKQVKLGPGDYVDDLLMYRMVDGSAIDSATAAQ